MLDDVRSVYCTNEVTMCHGSILWHVMINAYSVLKPKDMDMDGRHDKRINQLLPTVICQYHRISHS